MSIIRGLNGAVFQGARRTYTPGVGWASVSRYAVPTLAGAQSLAGANAGGQSSVDLDESGPPYIVEISSPDSGTGEEEAEVSIYELPALDETPDLLESQPFRNLDSAQKNAIRRYRKSQQNPDDWKVVTNGAPADGDLEAVEALSGTGLSLAKHIRNGQDQFYRPTCEFRWTRTVSDAQLPTASAQAFNSVARIFTTSTLINSVAPPAAWQSAIANAESAASIASGGSNYTVGWLKYQPTITRKGLNKSDIALRWVLSSWSTVIYGVAV